MPSRGCAGDGSFVDIPVVNQLPETRHDFVLGHYFLPHQPSQSVCRQLFIKVAVIEDELVECLAYGVEDYLSSVAHGGISLPRRPALGADAADVGGEVVAAFPARRGVLPG